LLLASSQEFVRLSSADLGVKIAWRPQVSASQKSCRNAVCPIRSDFRKWKDLPGLLLHTLADRYIASGELMRCRTHT